MGKKRNQRKNQIKSTYFNKKHPAGFGGQEKLKKALKNKVSGSLVSDWLQGTDTYTLHKPVKKNFLRRKYIVSGINSLWQCDLSDLPQLAKFNNGYRYILLKIDVFSRKANAVPLKTKSGKDVSNSFKKMIQEEKPEKLQTDRGKEFLNSDFQALLKANNIHHYVSNNQEIKASLVERLQRTIKSKLFRYFTHSNSYKYIDILQEIVHSYNHSVHSSLGIRPVDVTSENQEALWQQQYNSDTPDSSETVFKFRVKDKVRISKYSTVFTKSYLPLWSQEVFTISKRHNTIPPVYSIQDDSGSIVQGTFYEPELQKVKPTDNIYKIESVLGKRNINGKTQYLVKWKGYSSDFNSYVDQRDIVHNYKN